MSRFKILGPHALLSAGGTKSIIGCIEEAMTFNCGTVFLTELHDFVKQPYEDIQVVRLERTELGKQSSDRCKRITAGVPEAPGFYLWGTYNRNGLWKNIYLGMAGYGDHKSLRKRIREELMDERCCMW